MKVSAALTLALAGVSIGSPIAIGLEERDIESRALSLVPVLSPSDASVVPVAIPDIPNIGAPQASGLPSLPPPASEIESAAKRILQSILVVIANLLQGLPGNTLPIPTTIPGVPDITPVDPTLPVGSLTPQQLLVLAAALQSQLGNLTALGNNAILSGGLNAAQLTAVRDAITAAQTQLGPIIGSPTSALATLGNLQGNLPGGVTNLPQLEALFAGLAPVLILVTSLLNAVTGLLPTLGGSGLPSVGLPVTPTVGLPGLTGLPSVGLPITPTVGLPGLTGLPSVGLPITPTVGVPALTSLPSVGLPITPTVGVPALTSLPGVGLPLTRTVGLPGLPGLPGLGL